MPPNYQDSHSHLQDPALFENLDEVIGNALSAGIDKMVVNGTSPKDWDKVLEVYTRYPNLIIPSFGLHPWNTNDDNGDWKVQLIKMLDDVPCACIGECGLDLWMQKPNREAQEDAFRFQLELAAERNLPLSIHVLRAWGWLVDVLETSRIPERGFMLHSYGGSLEMAQRLLPLGAYFSFSGYFLHDRKVTAQNVFKNLPKDRILLETDAPSMLPPEKFISYHSKEGINHPANLASIASGFSDMLELEKEALAGVLEANFERFFIHS